MRAQEFLAEADTNTGSMVYHGTVFSNLVGIMKYGLVPRRNRWQTKYGGNNLESELAVFATPNFDDALEFAEQTASVKSGRPVVLAFKLLATDKVDNEAYYSNEILLRNSVAPDRLKVVYPKGLDIQKAKSTAATSRNKTEIIKQCNKLTKPFGIYCRSGSKTTSRILTYIGDSQYYKDSILLKDYPEYLTKMGVETDVVNKVSQIIGSM